MHMKTNLIKRIVDVMLTALVLLIMAYQVIGDWLHEWLGIAMTVIVICHHILNYKWYRSLFKGKYTPYRIILTAGDVLLLGAFAVTALSGMSMSGHAVPFMYGTINVMSARKLHLALSYWTFTLMGVHVGLHLRSMTVKFKFSNKVKTLVLSLFAAAAAWGGYLFFKGEIINYMLFKTHFAFLDYEKAKWLVVVENLAMLLFWAFVGHTLTKLCQKHNSKADLLRPILWLAAVILAAAVMIFALKNKGTQETPGSWQDAPLPQTATQSVQSAPRDEISRDKPDKDGFVLINAGSYKMGSPSMTRNSKYPDDAYELGRSL